jgi:hypothetical protein
MDERLKKLLEWLQRNQSGNPYAHKDPWHPFSKWGNEGIKPVPMPQIEVDPDGVKPVPMPQMNIWGDLPEYDPESKWYNPNWRQDIEKAKGLPEGHLVHIIPPSQSERHSERFNLGGNWKNPVERFPEGWNRNERINPDELFKGGPDRHDPNIDKGKLFDLIQKAQLGSAMPKYHSGMGKNIRDLSTEMATDPLSYVSDNVRGPTRGLRRENMVIPPPMRKRYPAEFDPATGQNRVVPGTLRTTYPGAGRISDLPLRSATQGDSMSDHLAATYGENSPEFKRHQAQDAGIELPKGRDWINKMHDIQNAHFGGADFGYEEFWPQRLGVTNEMIDMFMAVPEEALQHAMDNPTDAVLQEFEEYYGFPLNVNDPDMQKYFEDRKKRR